MLADKYYTKIHVKVELWIGEVKSLRLFCILEGITITTTNNCYFSKHFIFLETHVQNKEKINFKISHEM